MRLKEDIAERRLINVLAISLSVCMCVYIPFCQHVLTDHFGLNIKLTVSAKQNTGGFECEILIFV